MSPVFSTSGSGSSTDVRDIQRALNRAGGSAQPKLAEDGVLGGKTKARIIEFQRSKGLKPDGIVGVKTRAALGMSSGPGAAPPAPPAPGPPLVNSGSVVTTVVSATKAAFQAWKLAASFRLITILGPTASGAPGCLNGPNFTALITARIGALQGDSLAIARAAAAGIGTNFAAYQNGVTVPGLPWYPAFAAFPSAFAPPTPNVPSPLIALPSAGFPGITVDALLRTAMEQAADPALVARAGTVFSEIATQCSGFFLISISSTFASRVLGSGPVPSFAPPFVPIGPVVGGQIISQPGHLA